MWKEAGVVRSRYLLLQVFPGRSGWIQRVWSLGARLTGRCIHNQGKTELVSFFVDFLSQASCTGKSAGYYRLRHHKDSSEKELQNVLLLEKVKAEGTGTVGGVTAATGEGTEYTVPMGSSEISSCF